MGAKLQMAVPIDSFSHNLNDEAFEPLNGQDNYVWASDITPNRFFLRVDCRLGPTNLEDFFQFGHYSLSMMLIAINVATLGNMLWSFPHGTVYPQYSIHDLSNDEVKIPTVQFDQIMPEKNRKDLTSDDIIRAKLLFAAFAKGIIDEHVRPEYIKGLFHMSYHMCDFDFRKEAFSNFYRAFEFFVTTKILKLSGLSNEVKDISRALKSLNMNDEVIVEFKRLYQLRSEQVMHAQKSQFDLKREEVLKIKYLADLVMNKAYEPVWGSFNDEGTQETDD